MKTRSRVANVVLITAVLTHGVVGAQQPLSPGGAGQDTPAPAAPGTAPRPDPLALQIASLNDKTPLQVQVVVSRYQGDKRISSMPYVLSVNAIGSDKPIQQAQNSQLRMGAQVPVPSTHIVETGDGQKQSPIMSFQYRSVGTNIDCRARSMGDGRFELGVEVEDTSVFSAADAAAQGVSAERPVFRSFQASHTLILRDGQSRQFTAATDRVSGEVVRIDVSLTVVK